MRVTFARQLKDSTNKFAKSSGAFSIRTWANLWSLSILVFMPLFGAILREYVQQIFEITKYIFQRVRPNGPEVSAEILYVSTFLYNGTRWSDSEIGSHTIGSVFFKLPELPESSHISLKQMCVSFQLVQWTYFTRGIILYTRLIRNYIYVTDSVKIL